MKPSLFIFCQLLIGQTFGQAPVSDNEISDEEEDNVVIGGIGIGDKNPMDPTNKVKRVQGTLDPLYFQGKGIGGCRILSKYRDDTYFNISQLGVGALDNDHENIDFLVKMGCDPNHNATAMDKYPELEEIQIWLTGITPLSLASAWGSYGKPCLGQGISIIQNCHFKNLLRSF